MPNVNNSSQGVYWLLTVPQHLFLPFVPSACRYVGGQLECGREGGYLHWQLLVVFKKKVRLRAVKEVFGNEVHAEVTRSAAARDYCFKEDTRVENTQFELGEYPFRRSEKKDWENIWQCAKEGQVEKIPASIRVSSYAAIKKIEKDHLKPQPVVRTTRVYVGKSGVGKSRRAWEEAGYEAYPKDPCSKFWDGYQGEEKVVIDEFRGQIGISHILRWLDRYPVNIETKGSGSVLRARELWITSNLHPRYWYPDLDDVTKDALLRRLIVEEMNEPYYDDIE